MKNIVVMSLAGIAYADNDFSSLNNWTGLYAGINAGYVLNDVQLTSQQLGFTNPDETCDNNSDFSSFSPGIQLGYLHQFSNYWVGGIEFNTTFNANRKITLKCDCPSNSYVSDQFIFNNFMQGAIKGRLGRAINNNLLPYVTTGGSFALVGLSYDNEGGDHYSQNTTEAGWLVGAGIEWAYQKHWSLRIEYSYIDYGNVIKMKIPTVYDLMDPNGNAKAKLNSHNVTLAINYW